MTEQPLPDATIAAIAAFASIAEDFQDLLPSDAAELAAEIDAHLSPRLGTDNKAIADAIIRLLRSALATPAPAQPEGALSKLRHLYANMVNGAVRDTASAKRIATGLLGPVIEALEAEAQPDPLHVANERGEGEISGQSRKVISTDFSPKLRWCSYCGEGVTSFCRGKTPDCPMALAAPKEKP